jgi:alkanesulfonate monooxygenase SsuD/methylene tetrahydromethanopterin reductase-like flavin-dependent oxidoreductase (luciferase family)
MKFHLAINLERMDESMAMTDVARHTLEMVQMADQGGFKIAWAAEHHVLATDTTIFRGGTLQIPVG